MNVSAKDVISRSDFFDRDWYLRQYPDVGLAGMDPALHYLRYGARLGRNPGPNFDSRKYLDRYQDVARAGINPLLHFERNGRAEGRATFAPAVPAFDVVEAKAPEVVARRRVDVIVPVYNALDDVKSCLASLSVARTDHDVHVILINDGSDTKTTAWLRRAVAFFARERLSFELVEHETNSGYTAAVNTGFKKSTAQYVVTLNSDTIVTSLWVDGLIRCIESAPEIGIVGPLSNAATWQNVPKLYGSDGKHAINSLPEGLTPEQMARLVRACSKREYPRTTFVNGFCFLISRQVIDSIGYMDESAFPTGYGEENDFCIRAMDAGFALSYADDVYVYHSKSKSFGAERRIELSRRGGEALRLKHGADKISRLIKEVQRTERMDRVRDRVKEALSKRSGSEAVTSDEMVLVPRGSFSEKGYQVDRKFSGAELVLPYDTSPGQVPSLNIGVHLHLHYTDLAEEFVEYLRNIPVPFHLYVSVPRARDVTMVSEILQARLPGATLCVQAFPNRGRDIGPFLAGFGERLVRHDYVCHIHSKRSPHSPAKKDWRMQLLTFLMGSPATVSEILRLFDHNPSLGMIFPKYHWALEHQISWGKNYGVAQGLAKRLDLSLSPVCMAPFPAGSMFWARRTALEALFELKLTFEDFPDEKGQIDGTLAHAIERIFGEITLAANQDLLQVRVCKPHDLRCYYTVAWPYFGKSAEELEKTVSDYRSARSKVPAKVGVLCANSDGYDTPVAHEHLDPNIDYHLVTDFSPPDYGFWICHEMPREGSPIARARAVKTDPLPFIGGYDVGVWVDANVMIRGSLDGLLEIVDKNPDVPIFGIPHPQRECIFDEANSVIAARKAAPELVRAQMTSYAQEGYPKKYGLIETNFLVYNLRHDRIREVLDGWRVEITKHTHRDQLSLNYILWKLGLPWMPLMSEGQNLRTNTTFAYFGHGRNSGYMPPDLPSALVTPRRSAEKVRR